MATRGFEGVTQQDVTRRELARKGATLASTPSKYRNVKTVVGGEKFDSKREAAYWQGLLARVKAGEIRNVERQVSFPLYCPDNQSATPWLCHEVAVYVADFVFEERVGEEWREVVADAKGMRNRLYALKAKWLALQTGLVIREV